MSMDIQMKERLVGAVVLVLAAVVFIPMLLDGPAPERQVSQSVALPEAEPATERRTVRIALDGQGDVVSSPREEDAASQEPVTVDLTPAQEQQAQAENAAPPVEVPVEPSSRPETSARRETIPPPVAERSAAWTVQAGSFSSDENAEALAARLRELGYPAYVSRFSDSGRVHYRVRVGGFSSRDAAEQKAAEIRGKTGGPATPVPNG